ncbi:MAG: methyltransferase domain-containing protein [Chlorobiaceae bacterium]|nr:methyltransferase domain-containing protein [Chlorobiaceae bacterium]
MQIDQYKEIHRNHPGYGQGGNAHHFYLATIMYMLGLHDAIDFGCGKGGLANQLSENPGFTCSRYDPAIPGIDVLPNKTFDIVVNTDVLEHVPEAELDGVMRDFRKLSTNAIIIPHLAKATRILPNGENAHCTIKTPAEWATMFKRYYAYVYELPHHSTVHALFLCSDQERNIASLQGILELYAASKKEGLHHLLPLGKRLEKAIRLIQGKNINR